MTLHSTFAAMYTFRLQKFMHTYLTTFCQPVFHTVSQHITKISSYYLSHISLTTTKETEPKIQTKQTTNTHKQSSTRVPAAGKYEPCNLSRSHAQTPQSN